MKHELRRAWERVLARSAGRRLVADALRRAPLDARRVLALGKVATELTAGAREALGERLNRSLAITGSGAERPGPHEIIVGDHPVPGRGSLRAAERALRWAAEARAAGEGVLGLVSGGASALCEAPRPPLSPAELFATHRALVASGAPIDALNTVRRCLSSIKDGRLADALGGSLIGVMVLVDVPSGQPGVVASGPLSPPRGDPTLALELLSAHRVEVPAAVQRFLQASAKRPARARGAWPPTEILATPATMAAAMADELRALGVDEITLRPPTEASVEALTEEIVAHLRAGEGAWIAAGEASVRLPPSLLGADGGRARHLALSVRVAMSREAPGARWLFLAGASDGRDGAGASGALVGHWTPHEGASGALERFSSGPFLAACGDALPETPPRTNLTDLYLALPLR